MRRVASRCLLVRARERRARTGLAAHPRAWSHGGRADRGADAVAHRYIVRHEQYNTRLFRDSVFDTTVVVLNSDATVASTVHGDVVVINGDLFLQPGAKVDGRAVAIGGGVYDSQQAKVGGEKLSFRDVHFDTARTSTGIELVYRLPPPPRDTIPTVALPGLFGFRMPLYDRVDGLSLPWGPRITIGRQATRDRSHGHVSLEHRRVRSRRHRSRGPRAAAGPPPHSAVAPRSRTIAGFSPISRNSISTFGVGSDYRNYWRATRFEGRLAHEWLFLRRRSAALRRRTHGGRLVRSRRRSVELLQPKRLAAHEAPESRRRAWATLERARSARAEAGSASTWRSSSEPMPRWCVDAPGGEHFTQTTIFARAAFPTFVTKLGTQTFVFHTHMVLTAGDTAPPQRFAYIGGSGTLPTFDILSRGGDQMVFLEGLYNFPIETFHVPYLGTPIVTVREMLGSTGVGSLGRFDSNIGVRLTLGLFSGEIFVNPANGDHSFSLGLSLLR